MKKELDEKDLESVSGGKAHNYYSKGESPIVVDEDCPRCQRVTFKYGIGDKVDVKGVIESDAVITEKMACHRDNGNCEAYYLVNYNPLHISWFNKSNWYRESNLKKE